ncbi:MAG: RHS repeat domain-containing protein, partial [Candidatus Competibacterales bacterium]
MESPRSHTTTYGYTRDGLLDRIDRPDTGVIRFEYDNHGNRVHFYDGFDRLVRTQTFDVRNNLETVLAATFSSDPDRTQRFTYDDLNRLTNHFETQPDGSERRTGFNYDELNRLNETEDPLNQLSERRFDDDGNVESVTDPRANQTTYESTLGGRLDLETDPSGAPIDYERYNARGLLEVFTTGRGFEQTLTYDERERLNTVTDPVSTLTYGYDGNGNLETVHESGVGTITRVYDDLDRVSQYTDARGYVIGYTYYPSGLLETLTYPGPGNLTVTYTYDPADRLKTVTDWAGRVTTYHYDANGRLIVIDRPNGTQQSVAYNAQGGVILRRDGSPIALVDREDPSVIPTDLIHMAVLGYDRLGQLAAATVLPPQLPVATPRRTMTYAPTSNALATVDGLSVALDADGNLTQGPLQGVSTTFVYDARNRLTQAGSTTYEYDAEDHRIATLDGSGRTEDVINPQAALSQVLIRKHPDGSQTYYVYGLGLLGESQVAPSGNELPDSYLSYHYDLRGSTLALSDETGQVVARYAYGPYGQAMAVYNLRGRETPFLYNGRDGVMAEANGLYCMRARFYHPELRRFLNRDILRGSLYTPKTLNRYAYGEGDPILMVDPSGESAQMVLEGGEFILRGGRVIFVNTPLGRALTIGGFIGGAIYAACGTQLVDFVETLLPPATPPIIPEIPEAEPSELPSTEVPPIGVFSE